MNYYEILGISPQATGAEIKSAFKQLALKYHPDRNPNHPEAEEKFKIINLAYHTLSNTELKFRYDQKLFQQYSSEEERLKEAYREAARRRAYYQSRRPQSIYDRLGRFGWQDSSQSSAPYKIDKEYFKVQAYTLLLFLLIAGSVMGVFRLIDYWHKKEAIRLRQANNLVMHTADSLFNENKYEEALSIMNDLVNKNPNDIIYLRAEASMIDGLRRIAETEFEKSYYKEAGEKYILLLGFEKSQHYQTWQRISQCHYALGNFDQAIHALKQLHKKENKDIRPLLQIAQIYAADLKQDSLALTYYNECKYLFIQKMEINYGKAFELVINPRSLPKLYFDIFEGRAKSNIRLGNFEDAYTDCKWALYLKPDAAEMYYLRAVCRIAKGEKFMVCEDLNTAEQLGHLAATAIKNNHCRN